MHFIRISQCHKNEPLLFITGGRKLQSHHLKNWGKFGGVIHDTQTREHKESRLWDRSTPY